MIKFYFNHAPNPVKVALFLEEAGLAYEPIPVDTRKGEQFAPDYLKINPNGKVPAIVDGDVTMFDSNAILLYLAEKSGQFLPDNTPAARAQMLSWLMFVASGVGPFSGQCVHFRHAAPDLPYAKNRYLYEAKRHYGLLNDRLADRAYMLGDRYTLVDMAVWGWARMIPYVIAEDAWSHYPHLKRMFDQVSARPAAQRVNALKEKFSFKAEMDEEAKRFMFPQNATLAA